MKTAPKIAIQASLDELDSYQAEKVLQYIKSLINQSHHYSHTEFKRRAMNEIQQALTKDHRFNAAA